MSEGWAFLGIIALLVTVSAVCAIVWFFYPGD